VWLACGGLGVVLDLLLRRLIDVLRGLLVWLLAAGCGPGRADVERDERVAGQLAPGRWVLLEHMSDRLGLAPERSLQAGP
jgi:hypothetical protein